MPTEPLTLSKDSTSEKSVSRPKDDRRGSRLSLFLGRLMVPYERRPASDPLHTNLSYEWAWWINRSYFRICHCVQYRGTWNIPEHGPVIFAPNHVSYYDPTLVAAGIPYRMRFMAWDALFKVPILKQILENYGGYPVRLQSADKGAIEQTLRILRNGEAVMIFPEGARSRTGELLPFENGIARLALQTGATIVPVTVTGVFESWPPDRAFPRLCRPFCIRYHTPIRVEPCADRCQLRARMAEINEQIRRPIERRLKAYARLRAWRRKVEGVWYQE